MFVKINEGSFCKKEDGVWKEKREYGEGREGIRKKKKKKQMIGSRRTWGGERRKQYVDRREGSTDLEEGNAGREGGNRRRWRRRMVAYCTHFSTRRGHVR